MLVCKRILLPYIYILHDFLVITEVQFDCRYIY